MELSLSRLRRVAPACLVPAFLFSLAPGIAQAQAAPAPASKPSPAVLAQYDKNKNGILDADELAAMQADERKAVRTPTEAAPATDSEIVQLSPFEVNGGEDKGYYSSNAMSGTRLNSKLEDIASSVSVVTKQQLLDTAALDLNDIFVNEVGTEGTQQYTDLTSDGRGDYDNVAGNPTGANRVRGLAQATIAVGGFTASSSIPVDVYNIDAVEITRGPNSTIAGLGDAGGTVNLRLAKANLRRESSNLQVRADDWGGYRASVDFNRPIIRDRLAVRASAMYEEKTWVRKPSVDRTNRQQIQVSIRPFKDTMINASYERFHEYANRANSIMPREFVSNWRAQGRPSYDPTTGIFTVNGAPWSTQVNSSGVVVPLTTLATVPAGIAKLGSANIRNIEFIDDGRVQFLVKGGANSANAIPQLLQSAGPIETRPLWKLPGTNKSDIYDWEHINLAAPNYETNRADIFNVSLQQTIFRTDMNSLFFEGAWRREDQYNYRRMFIAQQDGVGNTIVVDVNEKLLDGRPNPFFGRPYIGGVNPQVNVRPTFNDNYRAQLAYEVDFRRQKNLLKWLGMHRLNGYGEYRLNLGAPSSLRYHDTIIDNPLWVGTLTPTSNITNSNGLLTYPMFFLGGKDQGVQYANTGATNWNGVQKAANYTGTTLTTTSPWQTDQNVTIKEVYFALGMQKKKVRTVGGSLQSYLLGERIIPTFGQRRDRVYTEGNLGLPLDGSGLFDLTNLYNFGGGKRWYWGETKTKGVVVKPFRGWRWVESASNSSGLARWGGQALRGMTVFYNKSDSFQPQDTAYNVFLEALPNPTGRSEEYGFSFNLFDDKFNVRLAHQQTTQFHTRSGIGVIATRAMSIDFDIPGQNQKFDLYTAAIDWEAALHPDFTLEQQQDAAAKRIGYTPEFIASASGKSIGDVNDALSRGWELELQFNPTKYWTVRMTGNKQEAIDSNMSLYIQEYINQRLPTWTTIRSPIDDSLWWTTFVGSGANDSPETYFTNLVQANLNLQITTQGKKKPQTREYRTSIITKYQLIGLGTSNRFLNSSSIGGTFRWSSKGAIGYYAAAPDSDGVIRQLDKTKPIYDNPQGNLDLMYSYSTKMFSNRVRASFQLNVRNVTENGRVKGVAVNPDGQFWQYRIIDPRQFILSASFDL